MSRIPFDQNEAYEVVSVNNTPYLCCDFRVDKDSIPEGMHMYECADAECNGRVCRIQNGVMVNFWGTIIGKEELPMENGAYYPDYDTEYDEQKDEYYYQICNELTDDELDDEMAAWEEKHDYNDEFCYIGEYLTLSEYLSEYERLKADLQSEKEDIQPER